MMAANHFSHFKKETTPCNEESLEHMRYNEGKSALSYILTFPTAMAQLSSVMSYGERKYSRGNYLIGSKATEYVDSLLRHLSKLMQGEMIDPESGCQHSGHLMFNAAMLAEVLETQPEKNDLLNLPWVEKQTHHRQEEGENEPTGLLARSPKV